MENRCLGGDLSLQICSEKKQIHVGAKMLLK
jgi:hypothetical protein